jgi:glutamate/tyrosine decarboxylase-like PLP-dependent enzyme
MFIKLNGNILISESRGMEKKTNIKSQNYQRENLQSERRRILLQQTTEYSVNFLDSLESRRVNPSQDALNELEKLNIPFQEESIDPESVIKLLSEVGSKTTIANAGGRYFGFIIGGSHPVSVAANWLASVWDQNGGLGVTSPLNARIEEITSEWLKEILPVSKDSVAGFVTGVTVANFCGLAAARHSILKKQGWNVESDGLFGAPEIKVVVGEHAHGSLLKALSLAGFGSKRVLTVPVDKQGGMLADKLPEDIDDRTIVCLQSGSVNTGAFDPAEKIIPECKKKGAWVHVDGAFGLWAGASPKKSHLTDGVELADSWATDAHKWLNVPYDSGIVFVKNPDDLRSAMSIEAAYLDQSGNRVPYHYTPELSKKARAIEIWATLRSLGKKGIADLIDRTCSHAEKFAEGLRKAGYKILNDVVVNQVIVSFGSSEITDKIISEIQKDGTCWVGGTKWNGESAMRISISSWATTDNDVERSLEAMIRIAKEFAV